MKFLLGIKRKNETASVLTNAKTLELLTLITAESNLIAEYLTKEKGISKEQAIQFITECIKDGYKTVRH